MYDLMMKRRYEQYYKYTLSLLDTEPNLKENDEINEIDREKGSLTKK